MKEWEAGIKDVDNMRLVRTSKKRALGLGILWPMVFVCAVIYGLSGDCYVGGDEREIQSSPI